MPPDNQQYQQPMQAPQGQPSGMQQPVQTGQAFDMQMQQPPQMPAGQLPMQPQPSPQQEQPKQVKQNTTQRSLLFSELRDNMIIMSDGSFRAVIACQSINFDLMSSREREGVEYSYQNFLNALFFPVQILVRSQRVDIGPYIDKLDGIRKSQDNMLLNVLMDDYIGFISALAEEANIMDKSFYVVVPYFPTGNATELLKKGTGFFGKFFSQSAPAVTTIDKNTYEKAKDEIKNRVDSVMSGLFQVGIQCAQLNTKQLGELYYNVYNPDTAVREPLGDFNNTTSTYVRRGGPSLTPPTEQGGV